MVNLSIESDLNRLRNQFSNIAEDQLPFATALMLTMSAQDIKKAERAEMERVFDSPTRFTLNSLFVDPATKKKPQSRVWLRDWVPKGTAAAEYLDPQIFGGRRGQKRYEKALKRRGLLPQGKVTIRGSATRPNKAGNMSRGQITKMLSNVGGQHDRYQNTTTAKRAFWLRRDESGTPEGIWFRKGKRKAAPFLIFADSASYQPEFDFFGVSDRTFAANYVDNWSRAIDRAMATAR